MRGSFSVGDVLFLDGSVAGLPYPTGVWVLCDLTEARAWVALTGWHDGALAAIPNWYESSVEDLDVFEPTGDRAAVRGTRADAD